uniref:EGF-like domain-containing protein n=1 Tax=Parascaris univalens TaxID=6257 RepID=A0A915B3K6_PARUN
EQPDCLNTAGAFLCLCFEYDNVTNTCKSSPSLSSVESKPIPVKVVPLQPVLVSTTQKTSTSRTSATITSSLATVRQTTAPPTNQTSPSGTAAAEADPLQTPVLGTTSPPCRCGQNADCVSGVCQCKQGWSGDGQLCVDVNECFGEPSVCGPHSICENSAGSYTCQCDIGYIFDNDGRCIDMDECAEGVVVCGGGKNSSVCVNTDGAYECRCARGYVGHPDSERGCVDVDECQLSDFYCGEKGVCKNLIGSYECDCAEGYQQDSQGGQCVDIDECKYDPCDKAAVCTNL